MRSLLFLLFVATAQGALSQGVTPIIRPPSAEVLSQADALVDTVFTALQEGRSHDVAEFFNRHVGYTDNQTDQVTNVNTYRSQIDVILLPPPSGPLGPMAGYDLLEESYLPGSSRYFRRTYLTYHEGSPLIWEFRFYVRPDGTASLNAFQFDPGNPFAYLSTSDMLLNYWFAR